jgi:glycosyltransferase involved in cell wall biosynthesis
MVQMEMTARHIEELDGISVRFCLGDDPDWRGIDVVHGMGITRAEVREARRRRLPVCLSVIYTSKDYRTGELARRSLRETITSRGRAAAVLALAAARGWGHLQQKSIGYANWTFETTALYESADMLLPNSSLEAEQIIVDLGVTTPIHVVPNAVDPSLFSNETPWMDREGVLYVGRLEPHKNQMRLIQALRGSGIPLTIVGPEHAHHNKYAGAVRREAKSAGNVEVVDYVPHSKLETYYNRARVHAVPSLFETTGLVSLEAALCGCNVVSTKVGFASEYLEDKAWYCDPYDPSSIRTAVEAALGAPPQDSLRQRILHRYTWSHTADETADAYRQLLAGRE